MATITGFAQVTAVSTLTAVASVSLGIFYPISANTTVMSLKEKSIIPMPLPTLKLIEKEMSFQPVTW